MASFSTVPLFPTMPANLRQVYERRVASFSPKWRVEPLTNELFGLRSDCKKRLQAWALTQGFAVTIGKSDERLSRYLCIHHGVETRNDRGLERRVERRESWRWCIMVPPSQPDSRCPRTENRGQAWHPQKRRTYEGPGLTLHRSFFFVVTMFIAMK